MRLWRISNFADLSGKGGLLAPARWHSRKSPIVYLADHPASALVEVVVHLEVDIDQLPNNFQILAVDIADSIAFETTSTGDLPTDWQKKIDVTQAIGNDWLRSGRTALLRVPSAIVPHASNWLLNPVHADAAKVLVADIIQAPFDPRLLR